MCRQSLLIIPLSAAVRTAAVPGAALETGEAVIREVEAGEGVHVVEEEDGEDEDVKDSVEDHLARDAQFLHDVGFIRISFTLQGEDEREGRGGEGTYVRSFGQSPADRIEQPEEGDVPGATREWTAVVVAEESGGAAAGHEEEVDDVEHEGHCLQQVPTSSAGYSIEEKDGRKRERGVRERA